MSFRWMPRIRDKKIHMLILLPGAFNHFFDIIEIIKKFSKPKIHFEVYDGVENSKWSGGRIDCLAYTKFDWGKVNFYNRLGIGVSLTFSNKYIDITSKKENEILSKLNEREGNGVIIRNIELCKHIKKNYPNLSVQLSVAGIGNDYKSVIKEESNYDIICPRPEFVFKKDFVLKCNPDKYKIMVNNVCKINCEFWDLHRNAISDAIISGIKDPEVAFSICECWKRTGKIFTTKFVKPCKKFSGNFNDIDVDYSIADIKRLINLGYNKFKISGRELKGDIFKKEICIYVLRILKACDLL